MEDFKKDILNDDVKTLIAQHSDLVYLLSKALHYGCLNIYKYIVAKYGTCSDIDDLLDNIIESYSQLSKPEVFIYLIDNNVINRDMIFGKINTYSLIEYFVLNIELQAFKHFVDVLHITLDDIVELSMYHNIVINMLDNRELCEFMVAKYNLTFASLKVLYNRCYDMTYEYQYDENKITYNMYDVIFLCDADALNNAESRMQILCDVVGLTKYDLYKDDYELLTYIPTMDYIYDNIIGDDDIDIAALQYMLQVLVSDDDKIYIQRELDLRIK